MKTFLTLLLFTLNSFAFTPKKHTQLLPFVQAAPDQGETNTCLFMASTGAMELLLNKLHHMKNPKKNSRFDLSESFLIWQNPFYNSHSTHAHFIEHEVNKFNHGEAILNSTWPFLAFNEDGTDNFNVWLKHPNFDNLSRIEVPRVKTTLLFSKGRRYATHVLNEDDIKLIKKTLLEKNSPIIVNYNDDSYWHVILIVGFDDKKQGSCYEIDKNECSRGAFYVRDSNGKKFELRSYDWFRIKGNAAAVVELE
jgi:hypothetical protein